MKPILRWVGGKARLAHYLERFVPRLQDSAVYFEPFLGAASLFLRIEPTRSVLGDANKSLVDLYKVIRRHPERVGEELANLVPMNSEEEYYSLRSEFNAALRDRARRAALFIYLNHTCFNGIWRVNRKGEFNVPFGRRPKPQFPSVEHLLCLAERLSAVDKLVAHDFAVTLRSAAEGDFVYLDPPYPPLNGTAFFTHYTANRFPLRAHERLAKLATDLSARGCRVLISNADTPRIRDLYSRFHLHRLSTNRFVASHGRRYRVNDLVITNYDVSRMEEQLVRPIDNRQD